jgi:hypothetical protein
MHNSKRRNTEPDLINNVLPRILRSDAKKYERGCQKVKKEITKVAEEMENQMKPLAEMIFIKEIVLQSKIAQMAANRLPGPHDHSNQIEAWWVIQSILVAAGNVSKILWPQRKEYTARGEELRKLLAVAENNLLSDRKFRNHFEHYDERIEDWFKEQSSAVYTDLAIDPIEWFWGRDLDTRHRVYNPLTKTLIFRRESFDLDSVLNELEEILLKCRHFVLT